RDMPLDVNQYLGVGMTLHTLAKGLLGLRVLEPDDSPTAAEAKEDLVEAVEAISSTRDIAFAAVHLMRLGVALGMRASQIEVPDEGIVIADVHAGIELLEQLKADSEAYEAFRASALAVSCIVDYACVLCDDVTAGMACQERDEAIRAAIFVAETSARAIPAEERTHEGYLVFKQMCTLLEADVGESGVDGH